MADIQNAFLAETERLGEFGGTDSSLINLWRSIVVKLTGWAPGNRLRVGSFTQMASARGEGRRIQRMDAWMRGGSGEARQPKAGKGREEAGLAVEVAELAHRFLQPLGVV